MLIEDEHHLFCPDALSAPDGPRHKRDDRWSVWLLTQTRERQHTDRSEKDVLKLNVASPPSFSIQQHMQKHVPVAFRRPGGYRGAAAPVPIPNTAVKRPSANGTSS